MDTAERITHAVEYQSLKIEHFCNLLKNEKSFDTVTSIAVLNEKDEVIAKIIVEAADLSPLRGQACHIREIEYPSNLQEYMMDHVLPMFYKTLMIKFTFIGHIPRFDYFHLCFEIQDTEKSILMRFFDKASLMNGRYVMTLER